MPNKADVKAWKAQLVAQAEQEILRSCPRSMIFDILLCKKRV